MPLEVECFVRCGKYQQALEAAEANVLLREQSYAVIKNAVKVAYDLKRNAISQVLTDFDKRYLRLKLVQLTKRKQQASLVTGEGAQQFDADQMSMSGMSSAESHQSGRSILSATGSDFSETSKKSRKRAQKHGKQKLKKKRAVKEGSPFEEEYLVDLLRDTNVTQDVKEEV